MMRETGPKDSDLADHPRINQANRSSIPSPSIYYTSLRWWIAAHPSQFEQAQQPLVPTTTSIDASTEHLSDRSTLIHDLSGRWSDCPERETLRANLGRDIVRDWIST